MSPPNVNERERSPRYPAIDLGAALEKAQKIYAAERRNAAPITAILGHWGYRPRSSSGLIALAALRYFGLLSYVGSGPNRKARLTEAAVRILLDQREDMTERLKLIQSAALQPPIYQELWDGFGANLPSDATLAHDLIFERGFTAQAASDLLRRYRSTLEFARLSEVEDDVDRHPRASVDRESVSPAVPKIPEMVPRPPSDHEITVPVDVGVFVFIRGKFPLTGRQWEQMLAVLVAMRPGLVLAAPEPEPPTEVHDHE